METYHAYIERHSRAIRKLMVETKCQPVLFIGSGMTKRYAGGPNWMELLRDVATEAGLSSDEFNYLAQISDNNPARIGTNLAEKVHFWAWHHARERFPESFFLQGVDRSIFLKFIVTDILTHYNFKDDSKDISEEIKLLKNIYPHAVITTNFDQMVEKIYPNHELIIGERIIPLSMNITGELYKIHGTISDPYSLVLTEQDYERFSRKRKYISSKMMTYFAEYPVFILGYGLGDSNVNSILSDLGEAIRDKGGASGKCILYFLV